jgi:peptide/nickel transport system substrate-binding protein
LHGPNNRYINDDQILQTVAQFFTHIGVRTKVETMPLSAYFGRLRKGDFSVGLLGWGSLAGDFALRNMVGTPNPDNGWGTWNWAGYSNPKLDELIHAALASTDESKRSGLARDAATLAAKDTPLILLHHQVASWAMRKGLRYGARVDEFTFAHQFQPSE